MEKRGKLRREPSADSYSGKDFPRHEEAGSSLSGLRVLVVEDDAVSQLLLRIILAKLGHETVFAGNGEEALEHLQRECFDLILMDIKMPVLNGVETTRRIRHGECATVDPSIPIVAVSACAMTKEVDDFLAAGMDVFLAKPLDMNRLKNVLSQFSSSFPSTMHELPTAAPVDSCAAPPPATPEK